MTHVNEVDQSGPVFCRFSRSDSTRIISSCEVSRCIHVQYTRTDMSRKWYLSTRASGETMAYKSHGTGGELHISSKKACGPKHSDCLRSKNVRAEAH